MTGTPEPDRRPLAERVRPRSLADMVGNPEAVDHLQKWAKAWEASPEPPRLRAAILSGPAGVGKTTAAIALANDRGWGLVEMNASDARNRRAIEQIAGRTSLTNAFGLDGRLLSARRGQHTLILLDEADCLFSRDTDAAGSEPPAPVSFREFLRTRYGTLDALAAAWGLGLPSAPPRFAEWSDIPASGGRSKAFRLTPAQRDLADWGQTKSQPDFTDRGGLGAIARLVRETRQPVILTVNERDTLTRYSPVFRTGVAHIPFWRLRDGDLQSALRHAALAEHLQVSTVAAENIVRRSHGDLRAALNDLDAVSSLPPGPAQEALLGTRDATTDFFDLTREVLDVPRVYRSVEIRNRLDATPDDLLPWMEENLPRATADASARVDGYDRLADADLLLSRARRFRAYGLWSYASEIMTGGVSLALAAGDGHAPDRVAFPQFLGEMGRSRAVRAMRTSIASKAGRRLHTSRRKATEYTLDFLQLAFRPSASRKASERELQLARGVAASMALTAEEVAYLTGGAPDDPRVQEILVPEKARDAEAAEVPVDSERSRGTGPPSSAGGTAAAPARQRRLAEY